MRVRYSLSLSLLVTIGTLWVGLLNAHSINEAYLGNTPTGLHFIGWLWVCTAPTFGVITFLALTTKDFWGELNSSGKERDMR